MNKLTPHTLPNNKTFTKLSYRKSGSLCKKKKKKEQKKMATTAKFVPENFPKAQNPNDVSGSSRGM